MRLVLWSGMVLLLLLSCGSESQSTDRAYTEVDHTYAAYADLLDRHLLGTRVDYAALKANRSVLDSLITDLEMADLREATLEQKLAFYINAYNLITLRSVIDAYPVESIKDIDGVFDEQEWRVSGQLVTLDELEHEIIRKQFDEPRIHVAVNCASIGCPPLAPEPYRAPTLDSQLTEQSVFFAGSSDYNRLHPERARAELSKIFEWFGEDFIPQYQTDTTQDHLSEKENASLHFILLQHPDSSPKLWEPEYAVSYLEYNWALNDTTR
ncbi:DUF547 domain-containing protein [candidate division GN15 bacterium]|nr:DUF547 domain-containing protein [candidate division GN15 bacterium]